MLKTNYKYNKNRNVKREVSKNFNRVLRPKIASRNGNNKSLTTKTANSQTQNIVPIPKGLIFYCKTCEKILDFHPEAFDFKFPNNQCPFATLEREPESDQLSSEKKANKKSKSGRKCDIVYGTERSIKHYFKMPDSIQDAKRREEEERAARVDKL